MPTSTAIISNVVVGSTLDLAVYQFNTGTTMYALEALFTPSSRTSSNLVVRYAVSSANLPVDGSTVRRLQLDAKQIFLPPLAHANQTVQLSTPVEYIKGGYLYVWTDVGSSAAITLTVNCIEIA